MMKNIIFAIPLVLIFASCSTKYEAEIHEIDSLITILDSAKIVLQKVDQELMASRNEHCTEQFNKIKALTDTLGREDAFTLDHFGGICKAYRKWSEKYPVLLDEVEVVPMQLKNLKKDLSKNLFVPKEAHTFLNTEKEAAISVFTTIMQMESGLRSIEESFLENDEKLLHLIEKLDSSEQPEIEA